MSSQDKAIKDRLSLDKSSWNSSSQVMTIQVKLRNINSYRKSWNFLDLKFFGLKDYIMTNKNKKIWHQILIHLKCTWEWSLTLAMVQLVFPHSPDPPEYKNIRMSFIFIYEYYSSLGTFCMIKMIWLYVSWCLSVIIFV